MGAQGSHGGWGPHDALRLPWGLRAHMGAGDPTMPQGSHEGSGLTWGLGTPRCLGVPMGAQVSHRAWGPRDASGFPRGLRAHMGVGGAPRCLGAPTGAQCCGNQEVDGPHSRGAWALHAWLGATALGSSSICLGQFPASCPLHLPMEPDAALGKIPSGVCCLSPPSRHPRWRRCEDKWKISS